MSTTAVFLQQLAPVARDLPRWAGVAALLVVFRPLLVGVLRAGLLVLNPRLSRDEQRARARMRDAEMIKRMIASSSGASHAAELQAMGARD
jgi:hypothetical protein